MGKPRFKSGDAVFVANPRFPGHGYAAEVVAPTFDFAASREYTLRVRSSIPGRVGGFIAAHEDRMHHAS